RPVPAWEALRVPTGIGAGRPHATPLVGREQELEELQAALDDVSARRAPRLVTLLGSPGLGKSRLVHEFRSRALAATWRQGRCVPYGSGVTYAALGEIVKAHAGIVEADSPEIAGEKLAASVRETLRGDPEAAWV